MTTPVTFSAAQGASLQLFTTVFLHTAVVVLQAPLVPLWVFGETVYRCRRLQNVEMPYITAAFSLWSYHGET